MEQQDKAVQGSSLENPLVPSYNALLSRTSHAADAQALYLQTQLRLRQDEYTEKRKLRVLVATWNVNGKSPAESLGPWLQHQGHSFDIVACGLQECDMSTSALILSETSKAEPWIAAMTAALARGGDGSDFVLLGKQQLGGVLEAIWARKELAANIRDLQIHYTSTGIGNVLANKGGTAIRMDVFDSSLCFVCSHLNAHDENVLRRNQDYGNIVADVRFTEQRSIWDHQVVFWFGDLNYRIVLPRSRIFTLIESGNWGELVANDQLTEQRKLGTAFAEFTEGKISWAPTYRYDAGTNTYDTSEKQRKPSYTDRVLHKAKNGDDLVLLEYGRISQMMQSDHKPVYAIYDVTVREIRQQDYSRVYGTVMRELDKMENDIQPQAALSATLLNFGEVRYGVAAEQMVTVSNTGRVMLQWRFLPKPDQQQVCRPWAHVEPASGTLMPGEKQEIKVTILVEGPDMAFEVGSGREKLDDVLVLHLEQGKDYFVSLQGAYMPTCFGCQLENLARIPQPIRNASSLLKPEDSLRIPKELWRLADFIFRNGLEEPDIFSQRGIPAEMSIIRECLDTGADIPTNLSAHSVCETVLEFLSSLAQPVIPVVYYTQAIDSGASYAFCKQIVEALPDVNYNVFYYLISFGRELLDTSKHRNGVTPDDLAFAFGQVLLRAPNDAKFRKPNVAEQHEQLKKRFVLRFLQDKE